MKLRIIIIALSLLAILISSVGSYVHYSSLEKNAEQQLHRVGEADLTDLDRHIAGFIDSTHVSVMHLAENKSIRQFLINQQSVSDLAKADVVLDNFYKATDSSVVYLMNKDGVTIASSNRHSPGSFVGKNYGFRPYFKQAIAGKAAIYMALGKTSRKRGLYSSQPIYDGNSDSPVGVAIIKYPINILTDEFIRTNFSGEIFLHDQQGVIFVSTSQDSLYKTLWKLPPESIAGIVASGQFGAGPFEWYGLKKTADHNLVDAQGKIFNMHEKELSALPGWSLLLKHDHKSLTQALYGPMLRSWRYFLLSIIVLVGVSVLVLYRLANINIIRREQAEADRDKFIAELQKALAEIKNLQGILPICMYCHKIKAELGDWKKLETYIEEHSDADFSHGICPDCYKIQLEELKRIKKE